MIADRQSAAPPGPAQARIQFQHRRGQRLVLHKRSTHKFIAIGNGLLFKALADSADRSGACDAREPLHAEPIELPREVDPSMRAAAKEVIARPLFENQTISLR